MSMMDSVMPNYVRQPVKLPPAPAAPPPQQAPTVEQPQSKAPPKPKVDPEIVAVIQRAYAREDARQQAKLPGNAAKDSRLAQGWGGQGR